MNSRWLKRLIDVVSSVALLVMCAPLLMIAAMAVMLSMNRPVLFRQRRIGENEREFVILKLRTMTQDASLPDAQRLTALGRLLRALSIDELPQLWNVLKGDMSLVGPRPLLPQYLPRYTALQRRRHEMKPGITGWAQVHGRNDVTWDYRLALDVWYVDHWRLALDLRILWLTLRKVLRREGISLSGYATMPEFMGSQDTQEVSR